MDKFLTQDNCDRCSKSLEAGRIMSMYNTQCLCLKCKKKETKRDDYEIAANTERNEVKNGNYNYKGIEGI